MTGVSTLKYARAAAIIRVQVADGTLKPGQLVPSGVQLARLIGFCALTCLALHWSDATVTTVEPPGIPGLSCRPEGSTPQ